MSDPERDVDAGEGEATERDSKRTTNPGDLRDMTNETDATSATDATTTTDATNTTNTASTDGGSTVTSSNRSTESGRDMRTYVNYALLAGLCLLAFIAALQFYFSATQAISVWVTREYRPLFSMVFNLAVLLVVGAGITFQLRRLYGE
ncbi:hypothetical protein [Halogranum rubrum]|nr:hypothetical protein [Halogranum salarium]